MINSKRIKVDKHSDVEFLIDLFKIDYFRPDAIDLNLCEWHSYHETESVQKIGSQPNKALFHYHDQASFSLAPEFRIMNNDEL